jgi:hypothetical protein
MHSLETEVQELEKRPAVKEGSGLLALREELVNEKQELQEARRGTLSRRFLALSSLSN